MSDLRPGLPSVPLRMRKLPVESRGYPVPFFVAWIDGKPDFRVSDGRKLSHCMKFRACWLCGESLGRIVAFVVGPMCAINRTSSEPPSHRECAEFAAKACPFLVMPKAKRREAGLPTDAVSSAGVPIRRNPGVALVWMTKSFKAWSPPGGGVLFEIGPPLEALWFAEGRAATRGEVLESIESGLPELARVAALEAGAPEELERRRVATWELVPAVAP